MSPCLKIPEFYPAFADRRRHHPSKALYGTTGGTYSARVFHPVFLFNWALNWEIMRRSTSPGQLTGIQLSSMPRSEDFDFGSDGEFEPEMSSLNSVIHMCGPLIFMPVNTNSIILSLCSHNFHRRLYSIGDVFDCLCQSNCQALLGLRG